MKKLSNILIFTALLSAMGCKQSPQVTIEGHVTEATDKMLYLDHIGVERTVVVDSAKLDKDGAFRFRVAQPECFDFYRLRIGREVAYLSVDSTETLTFTAALPALSVVYEVEGSEDNLMLKQLVMKQSELQHAVQEAVRGSSSMNMAQARIDE